jgi:hypothetical protein
MILSSSILQENKLKFRENKPKTLVFSHRKRAFWACFRENWVYIFRALDSLGAFRYFHVAAGGM